MGAELMRDLPIGYAELGRVLEAIASNELLLVLAAGLLAVGGTIVGWVGNHVTTKHNRTAMASEAAHHKAIEVCADFVGMSFDVFTRRYEGITGMLLKGSLKAAGKLPSDFDPVQDAYERLSPLSQGLFMAAARAETYVPTTRGFQLIHQINVCQSDIVGLFNQAARGELPDDWQTRLEQVRRRHDAAAQYLIEELRRVSPMATHRGFVPGASAEPSNATPEPES